MRDGVWTRTPDIVAGQLEPTNEIDLRALGAALKRRRRAYLVPTALAFFLIALFVNVVPPRYTGESQVLLENQETFFTRPDRVNLASEMTQQVDQEGVASQVQLVDSPDIARRAIKDLGLVGNPEFDPDARMGPLTRLLVLLGLAHDPMQDTIDSRMTQAFLDKLVVFSPPKTRVITVQFTSRDPSLAARGANLVAKLYIDEQSAAKRAMAKEAADALAAQIADLRIKLAASDAERERYRLQTGLLAGSNNMTISGQQLADINSDLSKARTLEADAQAQASMIRELLRSGKPADVPDVINNDIVRRISDQRSLAQAQLALEAQTLLPGHPRIKELQGQVDSYDAALKNAAKQAATSLENQAKIAGARVANLEAVLTQQKTVAGASNVDEVHLRALERTTLSYKDQLESSTTKYQEALARQSSDATPADARIISRAQRPEDPSFPKKLPFIIFGTVATLFFSVGFVIAGELLSGRAETTGVVASPAAVMWEPKPDVPRKPMRAPGLLRKMSAEREDEPDLVFAPVEPVARRGASLFSAKLRRPTIALPALAASAIAYLKGFGRSAANSRVIEHHPAPMKASSKVAPAEVGWDLGASAPEVPARSAGRDDHMSPLADRIVAAHVPGRGLHIVGTGVGDDAEATSILIDLGRRLSDKGRSIIVDLNRTPKKLAVLCDVGGDPGAKIQTMSGLAELLAGNSSFAEVIYRDHGSRLHFIPSGRQEADFRDFDLILDALSETYDFIVLLAPAFPQSEIAKVMAPYADFVVLAAVRESDDKMLDQLDKELTDAGARHVLVAGAGSTTIRSAQNVA